MTASTKPWINASVRARRAGAEGVSCRSFTLATTGVVHCLYLSAGGRSRCHDDEVHQYLPQFGWETSVLTVSNPSVPVRDESLCGDVPPTTNVVRARTFEPSYAMKTAFVYGGEQSSVRRMMKATARQALTSLLQPDPQVLWSGPAFRAAVHALRKDRHDVIVATAPPFSSLVLGAALSSYTKLPLVLDYRDEWDVSHRCWENRQARAVSLAIQRSMRNMP